jgi:hypothetical protein
LEWIDAELEAILDNQEYDAYWVFMQLYAKLDRVRAVKLARRAAGTANAAIRKLGLELVANLVAAADTSKAIAHRAALGP